MAFFPQAQSGDRMQPMHPLIGRIEFSGIHMLPLVALLQTLELGNALTYDHMVVYDGCVVVLGSATTHGCDLQAREVDARRCRQQHV